MRLEKGELKMLDKFRTYLKITQTPGKYVYDAVGITAPTFDTIMRDEMYIPSKNVRDKINVFMNRKLTELKELIDD